MKQVCRRPVLVLPLLLPLLMLLSTAAFGQPQCGLSALTDTVGAEYDNPQAGGDLVVFDADADLVGQNADGNFEIYAADLSTSPPAITQITHTSGAGIFSVSPTTDGRRIAFESDADLVGENADGSYEIYVFDLATSSLVQISHGTVDSFGPSIDGDLVAFDSKGDPLGTNGDGNSEVFVDDLATSHLTQITKHHRGLRRRGGRRRRPRRLRLERRRARPRDRRLLPRLPLRHGDGDSLRARAGHRQHPVALHRRSPRGVQGRAAERLRALRRRPHRRRA